MKHILIILAIALLPYAVSAQTDKDRERFAYISSQMKLSKDTKAKLQPIFYAYRKELKAAKGIYNDLKDKYTTPIKKQALTAEQAKALTNAHWQSDAKVTEIRKAYTQKFLTVLTPQQVYYLFDFANDSKDKRSGK